jgi:hypothetical protein
MDIIIVIGYLAVVLNIFNFTSRNEDTYLKYSFASTLLYISHVALVSNNMSLFLMGFLGLIPIIMSFVFQKGEILKISIFIALAATFIYYVSDREIVLLYALIGTYFASYAKAQKGNLLKMKVFFLGSASSWLMVGISIGSTPAIIFDVVGLLALSVEVMGLMNKKDETEEEGKV